MTTMPSRKQLAELEHQATKAPTPVAPSRAVRRAATSPRGGDTVNDNIKHFRADCRPERIEPMPGFAVYAPGVDRSRCCDCGAEHPPQPPGFRHGPLTTADGSVPGGLVATGVTERDL